MSTTCPKCKIQRSRKETEEGICEVCGFEQKTSDRLRQRKATKKARIAQTPIVTKKETEEDRKTERSAKFAKKVIEFFIDLWDETENACPNPVIFRNRAVSTHQVYSTGHQISFSWYQIRDDLKSGFCWNNGFNYVHKIGAKGFEAAYELAVHEFGHWLVSSRGQRIRGTQHGTDWAAAVEEIKEIAPFSEVARL